MDGLDPQADLLQARPAARSPDPLAELRRQQDSLRGLVMVTLAALIALCLGIDILFYKQWRQVKVQLQEQTRAVNNIATEFHQNREPLIRNFTGQLQAFAKVNRDFQPILDKYRPALPQFFTGTTGLTPVLPQPAGPAPLSRPAPK